MSQQEPLSPDQRSNVRSDALPASKLALSKHRRAHTEGETCV